MAQQSCMEFDVASIRPSNPATSSSFPASGPGFFNQGNLTPLNARLWTLLPKAEGLTPDA
jgi:hypothetical protein